SFPCPVWSYNGHASLLRPGLGAFHIVSRWPNARYDNYKSTQLVHCSRGDYRCCPWYWCWRSSWFDYALPPKKEGPLEIYFGFSISKSFKSFVIVLGIGLSTD